MKALRPEESIAAWASRWLQTIPKPTMVLSGMSTLAQMEDNIRTFSEEKPLNEQELRLVERIGKDFQLGGHKAAAIAMVLENAQIDLVSEMEDDFVRSIFLNPRPDAQTAFDEAMKRYGEDATVIAMPFGGATLPMPPA